MHAATIISINPSFIIFFLIQKNRQFIKASFNIIQAFFFTLVQLHSFKNKNFLNQQCIQYLHAVYNEYVKRIKILYIVFVKLKFHHLHHHQEKQMLRQQSKKMEWHFLWFLVERRRFLWLLTFWKFFYFFFSKNFLLINWSRIRIAVWANFPGFLIF